MREGSTASHDSWATVPALLAAAHELKSPLVLIRQLALQLQDTQTAPVHPDTAVRIRLTAERSLALLDGLTRAARLEDTFFENEPINISELCESVADELMPLACSLGQRIELTTMPASPYIIGNRLLLRSILTGLCDNALVHNDMTRPVQLTAHSRGARVEVGVRDFGPHTDGLGEMKRRLGRQPQPMSGRPRSSGLGLLIAEQFAAHMESSLVMHRHRTAGITLSLSLPRSHQLSLLEAL